MSSFIINETPIKKSNKRVIPETPVELSQIGLSPISVSSCASTVCLSNHSTVDLSGSDRGSTISSVKPGELSYIEEEEPRSVFSYLEPILEDDETIMMRSQLMPYRYERPRKIKKISQSFSSKCYNDVPIYPG